MPGDDVAATRPVASVAVDTGVAHLDRPFDYLVPAALDATAVAGARVRVRFSGRLVDGVLLGRGEASTHAGALAPLQAVVSPEPVLSAEVAALARAVADRAAGALYDVLRLALPPRQARVEREPSGDPAGPPPAPEPGPWSRYEGGAAFLAALAAGRGPRAVWSALPGPCWPTELGLAAAAAASCGRGAVLVVPDARDVARVASALTELDVPHVALLADLGPAERYRRWLRLRRGAVRVVVGTRAAAFAPVRDLGLVAIWDDGDDLLAEPRSPYVHARDVLVLRAHLSGAAALLGGHARTAEAQLLVERRWARPLVADRVTTRAAAPAVEGTSDHDLARDPLARAARLPARAFEAARAALAAGAPVLVQVPRRGYVPQLGCAADRTPARCPHCAGPLATTSGHAVPACGWCGRPAGSWRCPACEGTRLRALALGAGRTAEELGRAFPGTTVRTSGGEAVLAEVPPGPALVVCTPGAEPVAPQGYGAVLLLDAWASLGRPDLRAAEETLRRWFGAAALARPAGEGGRVVVAADSALAPVQALVRWDPGGAAARELADRRALGFPPVTRMAALDGTAAAVTEFLDQLALPDGADVLGPVTLAGTLPGRPGTPVERALLRVPSPQGQALADAVREASAVRSARKAEPVRVWLDPPLLA